MARGTGGGSKLAKVCNAIGSMLIVAGVYCLFEEVVLVGVIMLAVSFGLKILASLLDQRRR